MELALLNAYLMVMLICIHLPFPFAQTWSYFVYICFWVSAWQQLPLFLVGDRDTVINLKKKNGNFTDRFESER